MEKIKPIPAPTTEDNLELWMKVEQTDPTQTKPVTFGRKFTSIDAMYQIKTATSYWGPYGGRWKLSQIQHNWIQLANDGLMAVGKAVFRYPKSINNVVEWNEFELSSAIMIQHRDKDNKLKVDDDFAKKLETDILTKALSKVGFNADVFMGMYDDNKYVAKMREQFSSDNAVAPTTTPTTTIAADPIELKELTEEVLNQMLKAISFGSGSKVKERLPIYKVSDKNKKVIDEAFANHEKSTK